MLSNAQVKPLGAPPRGKHTKRYSRPIPGERVPNDTCKIAPGIYQYTAVDDCTRCRVLKIYKRRTASNTLNFIDAVIEEVGFPIQRFQTDRGNEFFAYKVQERLREYGIKFRPNKPASPQLNGKVERSQKTDKVEFYAIADLNDPELSDRLAEWQFFYNWQRPHGSLNGKTPMQVATELGNAIPLWEDVGRSYGSTSERIQHQNYRVDLEVKKLKECP